jgi:hypothetical protein
LGNVRAVVTDELQTDRYPTATLEAGAAAQEQGYYDINTAYIKDKPSAAPDYVNDNGTNNPNTFADRTANSQKMYQLNAATNKTGLGMVLKVIPAPYKQIEHGQPISHDPAHTAPTLPWQRSIALNLQPTPTGTRHNAPAVSQAPTNWLSTIPRKPLSFRSETIRPPHIAIAVLVHGQRHGPAPYRQAPLQPTLR